MYERLLERLSKLSLLVVDDFGLASRKAIERQDLLEVIEERYGAGATLVTSRLPVGDWHEYLGGGCIADAISGSARTQRAPDRALVEGIDAKRPRHLEAWRTV